MRTVLVAAMLLSAPAAWAQTDQQTRPSANDQLRTRYQLGVMEGVLEKAVELGAQVLTRRMQAVAPDLPFFSGPAQAHGFRLDGYGVFFVVEVPPLRRSVAWTFRNLNLPGVTTALESLRRHVQSLPDSGARSGLEQALQRIELQVGPLPVPPAMMSQLQGNGPGGGPQMVRQATTDPEGAAAVADMGDPNEAYTTEVKRALVDAMLDHSGPIAIGPEEWLTVAAQDNEPRMTSAEMYDVFTITLRIRGADLAAFRAERITREEARARVELKEF